MSLKSVFAPGGIEVIGKRGDVVEIYHSLERIFSAMKSPSRSMLFSKHPFMLALSLSV